MGRTGQAVSWRSESQISPSGSDLSAAWRRSIDVRQERRDEVAALPEGAAQQGCNLHFHAGDLQFDIEEGARRKLLQHVGQAGRAGSELVVRGFFDIAAAEARAVTDDAAAVGGEANVEFKAVAAVLEREFEGGRVFSGA